MKQRWDRAKQAIASWLPLDARPPGSRISTPQLVKRTLHVSYDALSDSFDGVPDRWLPRFQSGLAARRLEPKSAMSFASLPAGSAQSLAANRKEDRPVSADGGSSPPTPPPRLSETKGGKVDLRMSHNASSPPPPRHPEVWFDQCSRCFVNLPPHWRERLHRNNLADWAEFQRNPAFLAAVFTMMDDELRQMDLAELGLDASVHSSTAASEDSPDPSQPAAATPAAASSERARRDDRFVWRQQRSFVRDNDSDSEEFVEI